MLEDETFKTKSNSASTIEMLESDNYFKKLEIENIKSLIKLYGSHKKSDRLMSLNYVFFICFEISLILYFSFEGLYLYCFLYVIFLIFFIILFKNHLKLTKRSKDNIKNLETDIVELELDIAISKDIIEKIKSLN